nr:hypothetical protein CFP56_45630 [Quercus suber]
MEYPKVSEMQIFKDGAGSKLSNNGLMQNFRDHGISIFDTTMRHAYLHGTHRSISDQTQPTIGGEIGGESCGGRRAKIGDCPWASKASDRRAEVQIGELQSASSASDQNRLLLRDKNQRSATMEDDEQRSATAPGRAELQIGKQRFRLASFNRRAPIGELCFKSESPSSS